jgi:hypothetical protein
VLYPPWLSAITTMRRDGLDAARAPWVGTGKDRVFSNTQFNVTPRHDRSASTLLTGDPASGSARREDLLRARRGPLPPLSHRRETNKGVVGH